MISLRGRPAASARRLHASTVNVMARGLVAATRRILVMTAEFGNLTERTEAVFRASMIELVVLTFMIVAFVASLLMLRNRHPGAVAKRD